MINALTILGAIGEITRFPSPKKLVSYAGLGGQVHDSGQTSRRGGITKAGRRDLRTAMVQAAQTAANTHPHWKAELKRLQPRLGRNKAIVAIARKLLVSVWYVLTNKASDRFAELIVDDPAKHLSTLDRAGVLRLPMRNWGPLFNFLMGASYIVVVVDKLA